MDTPALRYAWPWRMLDTDGLPPFLPDEPGLVLERNTADVLIRLDTGEAQLARYQVMYWNGEPDPQYLPTWVLKGPDGYSIDHRRVVAWMPVPATQADLDLLLDPLRRAVARFYRSQGCGCCSDREEHSANSLALGELLQVPLFGDGSGVDWSLYWDRTTPP